jgi:hypothetical protein
MKNFLFIISFLLIIVSCKEVNQSNLLFEELPKNWIQLTLKNGKLVIYNSCDMGNLLISISKKNNTNELLLHGQQEDELFELLDSAIDTDTIVLKVKNKNTNDTQSVKFVWIDKEKGVGRWMIKYSKAFTSNHLFVTIQKQNFFQQINQPCKECWGKECTDFEK